MEAKEPALVYGRQSSIDVLRYRIISHVEDTRDEKLLHQCLSLLEEHDMPCYLTEQELDDEIRLSMKSGNASEAEVNELFGRWAG